MKKLLIMAVAACCLAACNKELGPEYKVAPVISNVSSSPGLDDVHAGDDVRVTATVTSEYGFTGTGFSYDSNGLVLVNIQRYAPNCRQDTAADTEFYL